MSRRVLLVLVLLEGRVRSMRQFTQRALDDVQINLCESLTLSPRIHHRDRLAAHFMEQLRPSWVLYATCGT
jgi:hypothetical protein